jgi:hypothetical protein
MPAGESPRDSAHRVTAARLANQSIAGITDWVKSGSRAGSVHMPLIAYAW